MECRICQTDVPAGEFCGLCGDHLTPQRGNGPSWLRLRAYGAAPGEHLLIPSLASSLFPHLPHRSRMPFRVVLVLVLAGLITFASLRMPAAVITVAALGLPLLFLLYMRESDAQHDVPASTLLLTAALGIVLGVGLGAADGCGGRPLLRRSTRRRDRSRSNPSRGSRDPGRRHDPDARPSGGGANHPTVDPRVVGRLHDRRPRRVGIHRRGHASPDWRHNSPPG